MVAKYASMVVMYSRVRSAVAHPSVSMEGEGKIARIAMAHPSVSMVGERTLARSVEAAKSVSMEE